MRQRLSRRAGSEFDRTPKKFNFRKLLMAGAAVAVLSGAAFYG